MDSTQPASSILKNKLRKSIKLWDDFLVTGNTTLNQEDVKNGVNWLYNRYGKSVPETIIAPSPISAQIIAMVFSHYNARLRSEGRIYRDYHRHNKGLVPWTYVMQNYRSDWDEELLPAIKSTVRYSIWKNIEKEIENFFSCSHRFNTGIIEKKFYYLEYKNWDLDRRSPSGVGFPPNNRFDFRRTYQEKLNEVEELFPENNKNWQNLSQDIINGLNEDLDRGKIPTTTFSGIRGDFDIKKMICYDTITQSDDVETNEEYDEIRKLYIGGVFELILFNDICIVTKMPEIVKIDSSGKLHCTDGPAVSWEDGYGLYFWNGINIPKEYIMYKDLITKNTILSEQNIEKRRCLMEILGTERSIALLEVGCIDKSTDQQGNPMMLYRTKDRDTSINEYLYYLYVIDPSTKREYFISVPPSCDTNWAKKSTFQDKSIQYRQGDVGLLNTEHVFDEPIFET